MFTTGTCNRPLQCIFSSNRTSGFQSAERNPILLLEAFPWPLCYLALRHWFSNCSVVLKLFRSQRSLKTASKFWWGQGWNAIVPQWYHSDHGAMDTQEHFNIYGVCASSWRPIAPSSNSLPEQWAPMCHQSPLPVSEASKSNKKLEVTYKCTLGLTAAKRRLTGGVASLWEPPGGFTVPLMC